MHFRNFLFACDRPSYSAGGYSAHNVPLELHAINRQRLCERLKQRHDVPEGAIVFLEGGKTAPRHSTDNDDLFRQVTIFVSVLQPVGMFKLPTLGL